MRWNQTFSKTENRLLEKCERENRLNPYQSETPNQIQPNGLADIDSSSEDSSGSDESNESEEPEYREHKTHPDSVPRKQPNQGAGTLLGNKINILNLEQDVHWKIMIMHKMIKNKEPWTEIKQVLITQSLINSIEFFGSSLEKIES